jgi:hypothetical protein
MLGQLSAQLPLLVLESLPPQGFGPRGRDLFIQLLDRLIRVADLLPQLMLRIAQGLPPAARAVVGFLERFQPFELSQEPQFVTTEPAVVNLTKSRLPEHRPR